ncbi:MAG: aldehyde dehydrogenase family protein [Alphaproteobacteria bacterium]
MNVESTLGALGLDAALTAAGDLEIATPVDGSTIARVHSDGPAGIDDRIAAASAAFEEWRRVPAPRRGELIRLFGEELRAHKEDLGRLVTLESGKILEEGLGEVQEMIDICDYAVGLSRQLFGLTIASERPGHRMMETWHPLGVCGVITAFNFPVAVWSWNFALAIVCGDPVVWKPSEKTPLCAFACQRLFGRAVARFGDAPRGLCEIVIGGADGGQQLVDDPRVAIVSATGSCRMGHLVAPRVAARFGRIILELGGNNGMIVAPTADVDLAVRAVLFSAVGTAGQRCTTLRRLIVHEDAQETLIGRLRASYEAVRIGSPLEPGTLMGPLIDAAAFDRMAAALNRARATGARVTGGERVLADEYPNARYVTPAIVEFPAEPSDVQMELVREETFAPILYAIPYRNFEDAVTLHNDVPQGLSSCIFTNDMREAEQFLSSEGSDCGIANVNIGPSGAEIGGAFGGEKETGGGRESGSDAWKSYMRRATNTVNYSRNLPLAQGIQFG